MAIIQKIRNRAGLLVSIIIGMALIAFILGDFLTSGGIYFQSQRNNIAEINGKGVPYEAFLSVYNDMEEITKSQMGVNSLDANTAQDVRQRSWGQMIQQLLMDREYKQLGLAVNEAELWDLIGGNNPHQYIQQYFSDPNTGMVNRAAIQQFLSQMQQVDEDNPQKKSWLYLEDLIYNERLMTKYNNLLQKGLYATKTEIERRRVDFNKNVDFSYILKPYAEISDSSISVDESDLKAYFKAHKEQYKKEASCDIRYIFWEVVPSEDDRKSTEKWIKDVATEIQNVDNANTWQYVKANSDLAPQNRNYTKEELPEILKEWAFNASEGDVFGPYREADYYKVARLAKINFMPDSVKASHILLPINQENFIQVKALADSLEKLIKNGVDFAALALTNSTDGTKEKGGDLGWFKQGAMVQPFNDSCFYGKTGQIKQVITQFGLHIIKITGQATANKNVQVAILSREIRPSETTDQNYFSQASLFASQNNTSEKFDNAVKSANQSLRFATGLSVESMNVNDLPSSRELVQWAFRAEVGNVTQKVLQFERTYVVAILDKKQEKGYATIEDEKANIEIEVKKAKKAEKLIADINAAKAGTTDMNAIASKLGTIVNTTTNIRFTSYSIPSLGMEPKLIGAATTLGANSVSEPMDGTNGVYIIRVDRANETPAQPSNFEKSSIERGYATKLYSGTSQALTELAEVEDNRINFF